MSFTESIRLLRTAQKGKRGVSFYSRWVNRPLGRVFAAAAASVGIGPNAVTLISAALTGAGLVVLVAFPRSVLIGIVVAFLLIIGFALDSADGQVARLTGRSSAAGEWLDHVVDAAKMVAVHAAVLIALWRDPAVAPAWYALALAYLFVGVVFFSGLTLYSLLSPATESVSQPPSTLRAIALLPADYGILAASFVLWGVRDVFLVAYLTLFLFTTAIAAWLLGKWFRSLAAPTE